jgi:proteasome alpha subunit
VAEVGQSAAEDQVYRLTYDGSVTEEHGFVVMGGSTEPTAAVLKEEHSGELDLQAAVRLAVRALEATVEGSEARTITPEGLEAAVLDRNRPRRAFKRLSAERLHALLDATPTKPAKKKDDTPTP